MSQNVERDVYKRQVRIRTQDCFGNQVQTPEDELDEINWDRINPCLLYTSTQKKAKRTGSVAVRNGNGITGAGTEASERIEELGYSVESGNRCV